MRVALVQILLDHPGRSARVQAILSGIRSAVDTDTAPDLVVLPGGCDGDAGASDEIQGSVSEAIAHEARDWGVYIAAGLHWESQACALLFDADGDIAACSPRDGGAKGSDDESNVGFCDSPYGVIGVVEPSSISLAQACALGPASGAVMAVPVSMAETKRSAAGGRNIQSFLTPKSVEIEGAHWAVVLPAQRRQAKQNRRSALWAPGGSALAAAQDSDEIIVNVDVPVAPPIIR